MRLSLELQVYASFEPLQRTEEFIVEACIPNYDFSIIFGADEDKSPHMTGDYDMLIFDRGCTTERAAGIWSPCKQLK